MGVRLPDAGLLRPATPPADFDLAQALDSLGRLPTPPFGGGPGALRPAGRPSAVLEEAAAALQQWASVAQTAWRAGDDVEEALRQRFGGELEALAPEQRRRVEALNGLHSNAEGLKLWLSKTEVTPPGQ